MRNEEYEVWIEGEESFPNDDGTATTVSVNGVALIYRDEDTGNWHCEPELSWNVVDRD